MSGKKSESELSAEAKKEMFEAFEPLPMDLNLGEPVSSNLVTLTVLGEVSRKNQIYKTEADRFLNVMGGSDRYYGIVEVSFPDAATYQWIRLLYFQSDSSGMGAMVRVYTKDGLDQSIRSVANRQDHVMLIDSPGKPITRIEIGGGENREHVNPIFVRSIVLIA